eukprot:scaffold5081_cov430-Prasinococcus_capsulatus_cf.AAC.11
MRAPHSLAVYPRQGQPSCASQAFTSVAKVSRVALRGTRGVQVASGSQRAASVAPGAGGGRSCSGPLSCLERVGGGSAPPPRPPPGTSGCGCQRTNPDRVTD